MNKSEWGFSAEGEAVRYGLGAIKNVGQEAINDILRARAEEGSFKNLLDLCTRVNMRKMTKRVLENLAKAGALDVFGITRAALVAGIERVAGLAAKKQKDTAMGQISLLAMLPEEPVCLPGLGVGCEEQTLPEWPDPEKLAFEKEAIGFYLTSHPLFAWRREVRRLNLNTLDEVAEWGPEQPAAVACIVTGVKEHLSKKGKMAFLQIEDLTGSGEAVVFADCWAENREVFCSEAPLRLTGRDPSSDGPGNGGDDEGAPRKAKIVVDTVVPLASVKVAGEPVYLATHHAGCDACRLTALKDILGRHPGQTPVYLDVTLDRAVCRLSLAPRYSVEVSTEFWKEIDIWCESRSES